MALIDLSFEVHCHRPSWALLSRNKAYQLTSYRLYIDNDLITERTWIWPNSTVLGETIWVNINEQESHTIKLEPLVTLPEQAEFNIYRVKSSRRDLMLKGITPIEVSFKLA